MASAFHKMHLILNVLGEVRHGSLIFLMHAEVAPPPGLLDFPDMP